MIQDSDGNLLFFEMPRMPEKTSSMFGFIRMEASLFVKAVLNVMIMI
jgi:hypothetical protein